MDNSDKMNKINIVETMNKAIVMNMLRILISMVLIAGMLLMSGCSNGNRIDSANTVYKFAMGTSMSEIVYFKGEADEAVYDDIYNVVNKLDSNVISWRTNQSELYALNNQYIWGQGYMVSEDLGYAILKSLEICEETEGALDITLRPLANAWNIEGYNEKTDGEFIIPSDEELSEISERIGYEKISYETGTRIISMEVDDMMLDFGAVGKGYALDKIYDFMKDRDDVSGYVVSVGGSILVSGKKNTTAKNKNFVIGIRDPKKSYDDICASISVDDKEKTCISTSGSYEKYVEKDGAIYHHILDRNTLYPARTTLLSVTVVCDDGLVSDALSTACFIMGKEKSEEVLKKYNAEAVFIYNDGTIEITDGLRDKFSIVDNGHYKFK